MPVPSVQPRQDDLPSLSDSSRARQRTISLFPGSTTSRSTRRVALRPPSTRSALPSAVFSAGRIVSKRLPIDLAAGRAGGGGVRVARLQPPVDGLGLPPQVLRRGHGTALPRLVPAGPSTSPSVTS